jgi:hypothetical protein
MRPMFVIVAGELGHHLAEMPFAEDQHMIQALTAKRAHEPLGKCIGPRRQLHPFQMIDTVGCG